MAVLLRCRPTLVHELTGSHDPTFQRVGEALQRSTGGDSATGQLDARWSALGL